MAGLMKGAMGLNAGKGVGGGSTPALVVRVRAAARNQSSSHLVGAAPNSQSGIQKLKKTRLNAEDVHPPEFCIPGLAEFAAAIKDRRRFIPSPSNRDPLLKLFDEFDLDRDGKLTPSEVCKALQSRHVEITEEQATFFINAVEDYQNRQTTRTASRDLFPKLVFHMAASYVSPKADPHQRYSIP